MKLVLWKFLAAVTLGCVVLDALPAFADEVCRACPFDCRGIGASSRDCKNLSSRHGQCCVDLDDRGFDQLRRKDDQNTYGGRRDDPNAYDDKNGFQPGDCPYGFHVNDRPCTNDERGRGCRDTRSPSGRTCVGWGSSNPRDSRHEVPDRDYGREDRCGGGRDYDRDQERDDCPRGYRPDNRGCSYEDRRHGCEDLQSRRGFTCVRWNR